MALSCKAFLLQKKQVERHSKLSQGFTAPLRVSASGSAFRLRIPSPAPHRVSVFRSPKGHRQATVRPPSPAPHRFGTGYTTVSTELNYYTPAPHRVGYCLKYYLSPEYCLNYYLHFHCLLKNGRPASPRLRQPRRSSFRFRPTLLPPHHRALAWHCYSLSDIGQMYSFTWVAKPI